MKHNPTSTPPCLAFLGGPVLTRLWYVPSRPCTQKARHLPACRSGHVICPPWKPKTPASLPSTSADPSLTLWPENLGSGNPGSYLLALRHLAFPPFLSSFSLSPVSL